jgi:hypothetical protein
METLLKRTLIFAGLFLGLVPIAFVVTISLSGVWSWLERVSGIESMGHMGPANWCYVATYIVLLPVALFGYRQVTRRS